MNVALWIVQVLLAVMFVFHGPLMLSPSPRQTDRMPYVLAIPSALRRFIGVAEILAAVGLILPQLTNILPWLSPLAAVGLVILMVLAIIFHIPRKEYQNIILNLILLVMAVFVAYGR